MENSWKPLINCEVTLDLNWPENCLICEANRGTIFEITSAKLYVSVVTLLTQGNSKLLKQLKSGLKEQSIGTNINQKNQHKHKIDI